MSTQTPANERPRAPLWIAAAAVLLGALAGIFISILVQLVGTAFGSPAANPTPAVNLIGDFLFDLAFVIAALYFTAPRGWMGRADFGYRRIPWRRGAGALLLAGLAYYVVTLGYGVVFRLHGTDKLPSDLGVQRSTWAAIGASAFVCAVAPMAEEFFFRGFLFGVLRRMRISVGGRQIGPWAAAAIVAVLFGLAHYDSAQPQYLIPLGFLGFVLCIVRWKTGSLYPCMALHSINNSIAMAVNEFHWNAGETLALMVASLTLIALVTGPISRGVKGPAARELTVT